MTTAQVRFRRSPFRARRKARRHPATLISTAIYDERLPAWAAFEFTAALQAAQAGDRPEFLHAGSVGGAIAA